MAYYALHKLGLRPGELFGLSEEEQAFIFAAIGLRVEKEKKEASKIKKK